MTRCHNYPFIRSCKKPMKRSERPTLEKFDHDFIEHGTFWCSKAKLLLIPILLTVFMSFVGCNRNRCPGSCLTEKVTFSVPTLSTEASSFIVRTSLKKMHGICEVSSSFYGHGALKPKTIELTYDKAKTNLNSVMRTIERTGHKATAI